jgi:hypothetical protein
MLVSCANKKGPVTLSCAVALQTFTLALAVSCSITTCTPQMTVVLVHVPSNVKCPFIRNDRKFRESSCSSVTGDKQILDVLRKLPLKVVAHEIQCVCGFLLL